MSFQFPRFVLPVILHPIRCGAAIVAAGIGVGYCVEFIVLNMTMADGLIRIASLVAILLMVYLLVLLSILLQYLPEPPHGERFIEHIRNAAANDQAAFDARQKRIKSERSYQHRSK